MKRMKLTEGIRYNVAYEHGGWLGNFSGKFLGSDMMNAWFETEDNGIRSNNVVRNVDIVLAIALPTRMQ